MKNRIFVLKKYDLFVLVVVVITIAIGCGKRTSYLKSPKINAVEAFNLLREGAAIKPRHSGSPGAEKTVEFISGYLKKMSVKYSLQSWKEITVNGPIRFTNIVADIPGSSDKYLIIGCHYDGKKLASVPDFEGANDGASGVAVLLAMIRAIKKSGMKPPFSLRFLFFDGEECMISYSDSDGLYGSRHYKNSLIKTDTLNQCAGVIVLDMVGDSDLNVALPADSSSEVVETVFDIAKRQGVLKYFSRYSNDVIDDHTSFQKEGIPAVDIIDFNYGPNNIYWHTAEDNVSHTSAKSLKIVGNLVLALIWNYPIINITNKK